MALQKCSDCGHEVSTSANKCPKCGKVLGTNISSSTALVCILIFCGFLFWEVQRETADPDGFARAQEAHLAACASAQGLQGTSMPDDCPKP